MPNCFLLHSIQTDFTGEREIDILLNLASVTQLVVKQVCYLLCSGNMVVVFV